jgi:hypothetical protein
VLGLALGGAFALIWGLVQAMYRYHRARVERSAQAAAAALGLAEKNSGDPRIRLYEGASMGCRIYLATHAAVAPGPVFSFQRHPGLAIVVLLPSALPGNVVASTIHMAPRQFDTGDRRFDQWFKLTAADVPAARQLFENQEVRDALLSIYGPGRDASGTGITIEASAESLVVRYSEARPAHAEYVARAALAAALKLGQRAAFLR